MSWEELLDTCTASSGTIDTGPSVFPTEAGLPARISPQDPVAVAKQVGTLRGRRHFEDSLGACLFTTRVPIDLLCRSLEAATGWDIRRDEAIRMGRRAATLLRAFNLRCGIGPELERPSKRYASTPTDGPVAGVSILDHWEKMLDVWYETTGYDHRGDLQNEAPYGKPYADRVRDMGQHFYCGECALTAPPSRLTWAHYDPREDI